MKHREERRFVVEIHLSADFDEHYEGDDDGFVWAKRWDEVVRPRVARAVFDALRSDAGWRVVAAPRGRDPGEALEIAVERARPEAPKPS